MKKSKVKIKLIRKSLPNPFASPTPNGGIKMFKIIVRMLIV
jgi:hypothetical protein